MKKLLKQLSLQTLTNRSTARKTAFTLAEVLITLVIIGVVAALTVPNLMKNINQRDWDTASSNFNRKLGRKPRKRKLYKPNNPNIPNRTDIALRSIEANNRSELGHFEAD